MSILFIEVHKGDVHFGGPHWISTLEVHIGYPHWRSTLDIHIGGPISLYQLVLLNNIIIFHNIILFHFIQYQNSGFASDEMNLNPKSKKITKQISINIYRISKDNILYTFYSFQTS